jgi:1-acyl-sn-glycerol-3-phosphate acyltransferase
MPGAGLLRPWSLSSDEVREAAYSGAGAVARYFDARLVDAHHLPARGGALLVGNHALLGIDAWALFPLVQQATGRTPRGLGLRALFGLPALGSVLEACGCVPGHRALAVELLRQGELCVCYPGGMRDSTKPVRDRYRLQWEGRRGFAHAAVAAGVPIIPVAAIGPDEAFPAWDLPLAGAVRRWTGLRQPVPPVFVPVARRVPFRFHVGAPLSPPDAGSSQAEVDAWACHVEEALARLIDRGLGARQAAASSMEAGAGRSARHHAA